MLGWLKSLFFGENSSWKCSCCGKPQTTPLEDRPVLRVNAMDGGFDWHLCDDCIEYVEQAYKTHVRIDQTMEKDVEEK